MDEWLQHEGKWPEHIEGKTKKFLHILVFLVSCWAETISTWEQFEKVQILNLPLQEIV